MIPKGHARSRWVGLLVVVLALTASRANFPLLNGGWATALKSPSVPSFQKGHSAKKSEGVTPSRRALESRRLANVQNDQAQPNSRMPGSVFGLENGDARGTGLRTSPNSVDLSFITEPDYLQLFLRASTVSTLPPPA
jgi:hypothetical protein